MEINAAAQALLAILLFPAVKRGHCQGAHRSFLGHVLLMMQSRSGMWLVIRTVPTHSGFEQGRNDYERLERRWPASTGLLIVSIFFAHKFWAWDATQMSLYWVARLPIERPRKVESSRLAPALLRRPERVVTAVRPIWRERQWLAAPFIFRTYKAHPTYSVWVPLTAQERENLASSLKNSHYCKGEISVVLDFICYQDKRKFELGGEYEYYPDSAKYLTLNAGVGATAFVSVFGLAPLIPMLIHGLAFLARRYWKWVNA